MLLLFVITRKLIELLLDKGANVNIKDKNGNTALHGAIIHNNKKIIEFLLNNKNSNVDIQNHNGSTPLHAAIVRNNKKIIKLLLNKGANIDIKDNNGNTPLDNAIIKNNKLITKLLLDKAHTITIKNTNSKTAFSSITKKTNIRKNRCLITLYSLTVIFIMGAVIGFIMEETIFAATNLIISILLILAILQCYIPSNSLFAITLEQESSQKDSLSLINLV